MAIRRLLNSHVLIEAYALNRDHAVSLLSYNEYQVEGVVWDNGVFYSVRIDKRQPLDEMYQVTLDGQTQLSVFHLPYAVAVLLAWENDQMRTETVPVNNAPVFKQLLPQILQMQSTHTIEELSDVLDSVFEKIDSNSDSYMMTLMLLLELHHVFELYRLTHDTAKELFQGMEDECLYRINRIVHKDCRGIDRTLSQLVVINNKQQLYPLYTEISTLLN